MTIEPKVKSTKRNAWERIQEMEPELADFISLMSKQFGDHGKLPGLRCETLDGEVLVDTIRPDLKYGNFVQPFVSQLKPDEKKTKRK